MKSTAVFMDVKGQALPFQSGYNKIGFLLIR